jgi:DNA-binding MarR family transcriptional regulator
MSRMSTISPAQEAWELVFELVTSHRAFVIAAAAEHDLTPMQAFALRRLEPGRPLAMNELAEELGCDASNVTGIVDRLEYRGLVERQAADHDRRVRNLLVTPSGARVRQELLRRMHTPPLALASLSEDDQRALRDLLRRAVA